MHMHNIMFFGMRKLMYHYKILNQENGFHVIFY